MRERISLPLNQIQEVLGRETRLLYPTLIYSTEVSLTLEKWTDAFFVRFWQPDGNAFPPFTLVIMKNDIVLAEKEGIIVGDIMEQVELNESLIQTLLECDSAFLEIKN